MSATRMVTNLDYEIVEDDSTALLDTHFKNQMEILIAEYIGSIPKNYFIEYQRLAAYTFYPPLNPKQIDTLAIDNVTTDEVKRQLTDKVYKKLESIFESKIISWNSVAQTAAKRFVSNAVEQAMEILKQKLVGTIDNDKQTPTVIVQRFVLINNLLKIA